MGLGNLPRGRATTAESSHLTSPNKCETSVSLIKYYSSGFYLFLCAVNWRIVFLLDLLCFRAGWWDGWDVCSAPYCLFEKTSEGSESILCSWMDGTKLLVRRSFQAPDLVPRKQELQNARANMKPWVYCFLGWLLSLSRCCTCRLGFIGRGNRVCLASCMPTVWDPTVYRADLSVSLEWMRGFGEASLLVEELRMPSCGRMCWSKYLPYFTK